MEINNSTSHLSQKYAYSKHLQKLLSVKGMVDMKSPSSYQVAHLAPHVRNTVYVGAGPRLSLDQKISFINENNCLAKRIIEVGNRQEFLAGSLERNGSGVKKRLNSGRSTMSGRKVIIPGTDHRIGSTNNIKRKREFEELTRTNLKMAKKLIDTKSVISYDAQVKHSIN